MKPGIKAYFTFNRTERWGVMALVILLLVLVGVKATMHLWLKPEKNEAKEQAMRTAWQVFKTKQVAEADAAKQSPQNAATKDTTVPKSHVAAKPVLFAFDPNTVDSATLRRFGLREKTTSIFLHWRAKGKVFRRKEELRKVYTLTEEEYLRLEPYIVIGDQP